MLYELFNIDNLIFKAYPRTSYYYSSIYELDPFLFIITYHYESALLILGQKVKGEGHGSWSISDWKRFPDHN